MRLIVAISVVELHNVACYYTARGRWVFVGGWAFIWLLRLIGMDLQCAMPDRVIIETNKATLWRLKNFVLVQSL